MNKLITTSALVILSGNAFGAIILIQNNFNGDNADDIGASLQFLTNGVGAPDNPGSFDPNTGIVTTSVTESTNASGFNSSALATIPAAATSFTVTYVIDSVTNYDNIRSNGFFLGVVTGPNSTGTAGGALFNNNDANSIGLNLDDGSDRIVRDGLSEGSQALENVVDPTVASIEDGFTFTLTIRNDNTYDASTTGLDGDVAIVGDSLGTVLTFTDFTSGGVGLNTTGQALDLSYTVSSVELSYETIPEPSTSMLFGLVSGLALFTRRRVASR